MSGCELHHSPIVLEISVEPPSQTLVEALGAIDVGHRKNDDLELQIDRRRGGVLGCAFIAIWALLMVTSVFES